jgi:hypothetical protein
VLRDVTERVIIASKGRFDRAVSRQTAPSLGLPAEISVTKDEFIEATTDVWEMAAERATRVGHPAPFPVELPLRLIELYTYRDDLVLDPFMGSGTTGWRPCAAGRHFVGYDTETAYVDIAEQRIRAERELRCTPTPPRRHPAGSRPTGRPGRTDADIVARPSPRGHKARELAGSCSTTAGSSTSPTT